jgi:hypothetical protein
VSDLYWRDLLVKYIAYVMACEGTDFIECGYRGYPGDPTFTPAEWSDLDAAATEAHKAAE